MSAPPLYGLVLSGGQSLRMGRDKGSIVYPPEKRDQRARASDLLGQVCEKVFISIRAGQEHLVSSDHLILLDAVSGFGPGVGMLTAAKAYPRAAWLVFACDFPFANSSEINRLVESRKPSLSATVMVSHDPIAGEIIEPLFAIWEPSGLKVLQDDFSQAQFSPQKTLTSLRVEKITPLRAQSLMNINSDSDLPEPN